MIRISTDVLYLIISETYKSRISLCIYANENDNVTTGSQCVQLTNQLQSTSHSMQELIVI
jgi:capsular polysaccharide biosynthesis protein